MAIRRVFLSLVICLGLDMPAAGAQSAESEAEKQEAGAALADEPSGQGAGRAQEQGPRQEQGQDADTSAVAGAAPASATAAETAPIAAETEPAAAETAPIAAETEPTAQSPPAPAGDAVDCSAWKIAVPSERPARSARSEARRLAREARAQCKRGAHGECAAGLRAAYALDGKRRHLDALAPAYEAMGELDGAICVYEELAAMRPGRRVAKRLGSKLEVLRAERAKGLADARAKAELEATLNRPELDCTPWNIAGGDGVPSSSMRRKARKLYVEVEEAFHRGEFARCVELLAEVYGLDGQPEHLLSVARVREQMGEIKGAICQYEQYLAKVSRPEDKELSRAALVRLYKRYIESEEYVMLQKTVKEATAELSETKTELTQVKTAKEEAEQELTDKTQILSKTTKEATVLKKAVSKGRRDAGAYLRHSGVAAFVVGGVLLGAGVFYGLEARRAEDVLSRDMAWHSYFDELEEYGRTAETRGIVLGSVGAAATIGGAVLYVLGNRASRPLAKELEIAPSVGPSGAVMFVGGRF